MAARWPLSRTKEYDINGDPIVGAQATFYNVGTTTPQTVYSDASLSDAYSSDNPVVTDGYGRWPAVYLAADPGEYRERVVDADDVLLWDDDNIDVPLAADYTPPGAGTTSTELLYQTGDAKIRYGTGALAGYVRANGRTLGSATSGATERANADAEDLFLFLWDADANLAVSGGRGANAAADWAANKTITLPDMRDRSIVGLGDMGNSDADRIADTLVDGGRTNISLGATVGASTHALTLAELVTHNHTATFAGNALAAHGHPTRVSTLNDANSDGALGGGIMNDNAQRSNFSAYTGTPEDDPGHQIGGQSAGTPTGTVTVANRGDGDAHLNIQPSMFWTIYIKL